MAFLGIEFARDGVGITVSYWRDLDAIKNWKENTEHSIARGKGRREWYSAFKTRIAKVERDYGFEKLWRPIDCTNGINFPNSNALKHLDDNLRKDRTSTVDFCGNSHLEPVHSEMVDWQSGSFS